LDPADALAGTGQEPMDELEADASMTVGQGPTLQFPLECCSDGCSEQAVLESSAAAREASPTPRDGEHALAASVPDGLVVCCSCGELGHEVSHCPHFTRPPLRHPDASSRGVGPHMNQTDIARILATTTKGCASGLRNNCLIDSLRQLLKPTASVGAIRRALQLQFRTGATKVTRSNFLQFDFHIAAILQQLGFNPQLFTVTCVDLAHAGHGDVFGRGSRKIYLARESQNHFVPLFLKAAGSARA